MLYGTVSPAYFPSAITAQEQSYASVCQKPADSGITSLNISADLFTSLSSLAFFSPFHLFSFLFHNHRESDTRRNLVRQKGDMLYSAPSDVPQGIIVEVKAVLFSGKWFLKGFNFTTCFLWRLKTSIPINVFWFFKFCFWTLDRSTHDLIFYLCVICYPQHGIRTFKYQSNFDFIRVVTHLELELHYRYWNGIVMDLIQVCKLYKISWIYLKC